jgi:GTPase SAR1 family protein
VLHHGKVPLRIELIDTAGQEQFMAMRELYVKTGDAFVLVFSIDNAASLREIETMYSQIRAQRVTVTLIGHFGVNFFCSHLRSY